MWFRDCLVLSFCIFNHVFGQHIKDCKLNVTNGDDEKYLPILLINHTTRFELVVPKMGVVNLRRGEGITLACTGQKNYLTTINSNVTYATCVEKNILKVAKKNTNFNDLLCGKTVRGDVKKSRRSCANSRGHIQKIGYQITRNYWITLMKVCYDEDTGTTYYTEHELHGREIKYSSKPSDRPGFSTEGLGANISANVAYKQTYQKSRLNKILQSARVAQNYINARSFLARGHLSPEADFLTTTSKRSTYYYINVSPQWQAINTGNWKSMEISVRKAAQKYNCTFKIVTGTYGVLTLPDVNKASKPLYLVDEKRLAVPEFIWKIVYNESSRKGISFIVLNNPFVEEPPQNLLCNDVCNQYNWGTNHWVDFTKGFVYCCTLDEFFKAVDFAPRLEVTGVLSGV